ncbi:hypothetical protein B1R32_1352 [Abditibacterium utsteinense]|uniref:Uncharacterized protein n=1 Tax=Abditibacterium utsteinense TaxID=1960156 RepID=A0A2S8SNS2_9BACT|nr:hypothetical protein [Abditibacterium utsteinense]PQV62438.1 hypothetical protein B1R32_1352 [Abditibacterium utsteinense]
MATQPTLWNRFCAAMSGEVSGDTLEAYRRASLGVYDALEHAESHRAGAKTDGKNAWTLADGTKAEILCSWNAFVLQTLGDRILDADYENDPHTRGFVPPVTSDQILSFYGQVEGWLSRASQAHHNPHYKLDVAVPAPLPAWSEVEPCPNAHLFGMLEAMRAVRDHTEAALTFLGDSPPQSEEQKKGLGFIRQIQAQAETKARYADDMMGDNPSLEVHERVEEHVKAAIESFYLLGQLLAMPELAGKIALAPPAPFPTPTATPVPTPIPNASPASNFDWTRAAFPTPVSPVLNARLPMPHEAGFDLWCLTAPDAREKFKNDREAVKAIKTLFQLDPDVRRTLDIQSEINAALLRGDIEIAKDRYNQKLGHFFCAPWGSVYVAKRSVLLGGMRINALQQFIFNVTCEGVNLGAPFEREIMIGNFTPTTKFEYGDPNEQPDH